MDEHLKKLLNTAVSEGASDLHLTVGAPPTLRIAGELSPILEASPLSAEEIRNLVFSLVSEEQRDHLLVNKELDFSFSLAAGEARTGNESRFRVNAYYTKGNLAAAFRRIPLTVPRIEELHLPQILYQFAQQQQGFILVTGPAGCGKSTTIASMLDEICRTRAVHILTIEDPIEYLFSHDKALIDQREVGSDTNSWSIALRSVLREDPDVVFVGEMRDAETISSAVTIAETGHLVFATLHTNSAAQSMDRIIDVFPEAQQGQIAAQLAATLEAVVSQRLLPAIGGGLVPACEILLSTPAVKNMIREGNTHQIDNVITTSFEQGMVTLERALVRLVKEGRVEIDVARRFTLKPEEFERLMR